MPSLIFLHRKGLERSNPTVRWTVGRDGLTERNLNLLPMGSRCKRVPSGVYRLGEARKGGTSPQTGAKIESWRAIFSPWESPSF